LDKGFLYHVLRIIGILEKTHGHPEHARTVLSVQSPLCLPILGPALFYQFNMGQARFYARSFSGSSIRTTESGARCKMLWFWVYFNKKIPWLRANGIYIGCRRDFPPIGPSKGSNGPCCCPGWPCCRGK